VAPFSAHLVGYVSNSYWNLPDITVRAVTSHE